VNQLRRGIAWVLVAVALPTCAHADWLVTPYLGRTVRGATNIIDLEHGGTSPHWVFGVSGAWLGGSIVGVEGDAARAPHYFERGSLDQVLGSHITTLSGNVLLTLPRRVTRESLRPYAVAGLGLLQAHIDDAVFPVNARLLALTLGGGATGFVTERTGVRFDLRRVRSISGDGETLTGIARAQLSFWRASVGVTLRY
jgi:hypothetical protein